MRGCWCFFALLMLVSALGIAGAAEERSGTYEELARQGYSAIPQLVRAMAEAENYESLLPPGGLLRRPVRSSGHNRNSPPRWRSSAKRRRPGM